MNTEHYNHITLQHYNPHYTCFQVRIKIPLGSEQHLYLVLFTAQLFFWPCVLIKDTYWANYSPQPSKKHIFSPPVRSHWHLLTKEDTGQPELAELLGPFEAAWEWFILKMVWLSFSKPREIHLDAWSMTEQYQTEVQVVVHRVCEKGTGHHWASLTLSEQVMVYHAAFRLQCSVFIHASCDVPLLSPAWSYGTRMGWIQT